MAWEQEMGIKRPPPHVAAHPLSRERAAMQEEETLYGSIFPSLDPVRPFTKDSKAASKRKKKAEQKRQKQKDKRRAGVGTKTRRSRTGGGAS